jgi:hypothetical protein
MAVVGSMLAPAARGQADSAPAGVNPSSATPQPTMGGAATQPMAVHFKRFVITDDQGFKGMEVFHGVMPVDWTVKGGVIWRMALDPPDKIRIHWGDAQDLCAFDVYPLMRFAWSNNVGGRGRARPGQIQNGNIIKEPPTDQFDAFDKVIVQMFRPDLANAKVVNKQDMPKVAKAIHDRINTDPNWPIGVEVGRETFEYELKGQTVQEAIYGVVTVGGDNRMGGFKLWSVGRATSVRAPKTSFDQLKPVSAIMWQSLEMNPAWNQKVAALINQRQQKALADQRQRAEEQNAQFNAIESRISSESAANDAQHESYWQHSADLNRQSENEADVQREVSPWKDSDGTTYKLPTEYGHAWSGADGQIIMNNDPGYNPNTDPSLTSTSWTAMEQGQN